MGRWAGRLARRYVYKCNCVHNMWRMWLSGKMVLVVCIHARACLAGHDRFRTMFAGMRACVCREN